jgi:hypothetical protein
MSEQKLFRETTDYQSRMDDGLRVNRAEEPKQEQARAASPDQQKHTPGPWRVVDLRHQQRGQILIMNPLVDVANVLARNPDAEANARLIAAAPDLRAALERTEQERDKQAAEADRYCSLYVDLLAALKAIEQSTREDERGEQWTIRAFLNNHGVFNGDISSSRRLVAEACKLAIAKADPPVAIPS